MNTLSIHNVVSITVKRQPLKGSSGDPTYCNILTLIDDKGQKTSIEIYSDKKYDITEV